MEPSSAPMSVPQSEQKNFFCRVTPLSKYLAMLLFILLPFIGGYVGYIYAPEKVVEVEKIVTVESLGAEHSSDPFMIFDQELDTTDITTIHYKGEEYSFMSGINNFSMHGEKGDEWVLATKNADVDTCGMQSSSACYFFILNTDREPILAGFWNEHTLSQYSSVDLINPSEIRFMVNEHSGCNIYESSLIANITTGTSTNLGERRLIGQC